MARERLTDAIVEDLASGARGTVIWDTELWGFACRLPRGRGEPTYFVYYRTRRHGLRRRLDLGTRRSMSCAQAREVAQDLIGRNAPHQLWRSVPKELRGAVGADAPHEYRA